MALKLVTDETPSPRRRVKSEKIKTAYRSGDKLRILDAMFQTAASIAEDPDQAARDRTAALKSLESLLDKAEKAGALAGATAPAPPQVSKVRKAVGAEGWTGV